MMKSTIKSCFGILCLLGASAATAEKDCEKKCSPYTEVKVRAVERLIVLAPGERGNVPSVCLSGEAVVGGGPSKIPAALDIVYSTFFFDGTNSGWQVEWKNNGTDTVWADLETGALCVKGTMTAG